MVQLCGGRKHSHSSKHLEIALPRNQAALLVGRYPGLASVVERDLKTAKTREQPKHPQTDENMMKWGWCAVLTWRKS